MSDQLKHPPRSEDTLEESAPCIDWADACGALRRETSITADISRKVRLLHQLAEMQWRRLEDEAAAAETYGFVLQLAPEDEAALRASVELFRCLDLPEQEARTLERLQSLTATNPAVLRRDDDDLGGAAASSARGSLPAPDTTAENTQRLRRALQLCPADAVEELRTLEDALRREQMLPELLQVLKQLAAAQEDEQGRAHLLREVVRVHRRLNSPPHLEAEALQQLLQAVPDEWPAAERLFVLRQRMDDPHARAQLLEVLIPLASGVGRDLLTAEAAALNDDELQDPEAALRYYLQLLEERPSHPVALAVCRDLHLEWDDHEAAVSLLDDAARASLDPEERAGLHAEAARIADDKLGDLPLAAMHWQAAARDAPEDLRFFAEAHRALRQGESWRLLEDALLSKVMLTTNPAEKRSRYWELADLAQHRLKDHHQVARYLQQVLQLAPNDQEAMDRLEELLREHQQWRRLASVLDRREAGEAHDEHRVELLLEIAELQQERLNDAGEALNSYGRVLALVPGHRGAAEASLRILAQQDRWPESVTLLHDLIAAEEHPEELKRLHLELGRIRLRRLADPGAAMIHFEVALNLDHTPGEVLSLLPHLEGPAESGDPQEGEHWGLVVNLLRKRSEMENLPPDERSATFRTLGLILRDRQQDCEGAREALIQALRLDHTNLEAITAIKDMASSQQRWWEVVHLCQREARLVRARTKRAEVLLEKAQVLHQRLHNSGAAVAPLIQAQRLVPEGTDALQQLAAIHYEAEHWEEAAPLYRRLVNSTEGLHAPHEYLYRLGFIAERLDDPDEALSSYLKSFTHEPLYLPTLERLLELCFEHQQWDNTVRVADNILEHHSQAKPPGELANLHFRRGLCAIYIGQRDAGVKALQELTLGPNAAPFADREAWTEVARPWSSTALEPRLLPLLRAEERQSAEEGMEHCLRYVPDHGQALQVLAALSLASEEWEHGMGHCEAAARSARLPLSRRGALMICAGEIAHQHLADDPRAIRCWHRALELDPEASQARQRLVDLDPPHKEDAPMMLTRVKHQSSSSQKTQGDPPEEADAAPAPEPTRPPSEE